MNATLHLSFSPGRDAVTFVIVPPPPMTTFSCAGSQTDLTARAGGATWGDAQAIAAAQEAATARFPDAGIVVVSSVGGA